MNMKIKEIIRESFNTPQAEPAEAELVSSIIDALIEINPAFKERIIIQDQLKNCDAYIATGSNSAGQYFDQYFDFFVEFTC
jgi:predicted secreted protein